jgi:hypothetical protein
LLAEAGVFELADDKGSEPVRGSIEIEVDRTWDAQLGVEAFGQSLSLGTRMTNLHGAKIAMQLPTGINYRMLWLESTPGVTWDVYAHRAGTRP